MSLIYVLLLHTARGVNKNVDAPSSLRTLVVC